MSSYRVAPIFLIRMAGVPFEALERLGVPESVALSRRLAVLQKKRAEAVDIAEHFFDSRVRLLSREAYQALRVAVRSQRSPVSVSGPQPAIFTDYADASLAVESGEFELTQVLERETNAARSALIEFSRRYVTDYLLFGAEGVRGLLSKQLDAYPCEWNHFPTRHNAARKIEQSLLLYLQRVAGKNDTFSQFGPSSWGTVSREIKGVMFAPRDNIAGREIFLERWVAYALASAMNGDPEIYPELVPRINPFGRLKDMSFHFTDKEETIALSDREFLILNDCDGTTPVHAFKADAEDIRALVAKDILRCRIEVPALEPHAVTVLREDVEKWRPGPARQRWLPVLQTLCHLSGRFLESRDTGSRSKIGDETRACLRSVGTTEKEHHRFLYSATNAIGEECYRISNFVINEDLLDDVAEQARPWIDFWRDTYAFVASRVATGLRQIFVATAEARDRIPLPAFLLSCEEARLSLTGAGLVALATLGFREVKAAFQERLKTHQREAEYELTLEDCHVVRDNLSYPKFDEYTYPSADLQISAASFADVAEGNFEWIISELHPPVALLHHGFYWGCPNKALLGEALASTVFERPNIHFGIFAADFTAHTTVRFFDALPQLTNFVAPQRGNPKWRTVRPADAEVFIDETTGDVGVRTIHTHEYLGSFARNWIIPLGFHPFHFGIAPHTPRLRCGNVIVQRRAWTINEKELRPGNFTGISRDLVLAIEQLRAERDLPRYVYIRPTEQALRRSGAEGRDKDTKPVFIDLESYLFLEIFHRWLKKAGEIEVTEMLPDPDHLCWKEADGRRTFELRTLIVPRT